MSRRTTLQPSGTPGAPGYGAQGHATPSIPFILHIYLEANLPVGLLSPFFLWVPELLHPHLLDHSSASIPPAPHGKASVFHSRGSHVLLDEHQGLAQLCRHPQD